MKLNTTVKIQKKRFEEERFIVGNFSNTYETSSITTNFRELSTVEELWKWLDVVFLDTFTYSSGYMFITSENHLLGPPRIMQSRISNTTCIATSLFKNHFQNCYAYFDKNFEDKLSFGFKNRSAWHFQHNVEDNQDYIQGRFGLYPTTGFKQVLSLDENENKAIFQELYNGNWIDRKTRMIIVEFSLYNANLDMLCFVQLIIEKLPTGTITTSSNVQSIHLFNLKSGTDITLICLQAFLVVLLLYYTLEELLEMYKFRIKYCTKLWNLIDLSIAAILYVGMAFTIYREVFVGEKLERHVNAPHEFVNFEIFVQRQKQFKNCVGVCLFLAWIKSLKYLSFNKTMMQFSTTVSRCFKDLLGFGLMFSIVFIAYAQLGYIAFGNELEDFHTFSSSIFTLFRTILGEFDYLEIERANHILGPIYFMSYIFFVFFVLLNMFLAIINDTYSDIKREIQQDSIPVGEFIFRKIKYYWNKCVLCKKSTNFNETSMDDDLMFTKNFDIDIFSHRSSDQEKFNESQYHTFQKIKTLENRIEILEIKLQKVVGRLDTFIKNVTRSVNNETKLL
uniref:CSON005454 protein n=1 Tax=Culicoides sonorensis TaxID=179676 RepID=A0A336LV54_CULSO